MSSHRPSSITFLLFSPLPVEWKEGGALDKNPFRLLKTDRNEAEMYSGTRRMQMGHLIVNPGYVHSDHFAIRKYLVDYDVTTILS